MPTIAEIFAHTLKEIGVRYVFGVPSGNMIDYIEAIRKEKDIEFVLVGHETTASFMADVCGRLTGIPGICFGTFGPGATNLSTGVGGALLDRSPLIAFTDEMPDNLLHRTVQMNINHQQLFKPITKWTTRLNENKVSQTIFKGAETAISETPGSVHIGIPSGIGKTVVNELEDKNNFFQPIERQMPGLNPELFERAKIRLTNSKKPILVIGLSAVRAGVKDLILQIAEKFKLPVVLTPMAKGLFPENHKLYAGVLFHALSNQVAETYSEADLIIGIGYDPVEFNYEDWMPPMPLIHINNKAADVDELQIKNVVNVLGNLNVLLDTFLKIDLPPSEWDLKVLLKRKEKLFQKLTPGENTFGPLAVVNELRKILPDDGILTVDVGAHLHLIGQQWRTPEPQKLIMTNGWSSMGFAIPAALAAKLCHPEFQVAAIMGDGGFLMAVGELATAKRLNLKIVFVVIYDNSLSLIRIKQDKKKFDNSYGTALNELPQKPTNHYFGVPVIRATNRAEYKKALKKGFDGNGPVVIEAVVDGEEYNELVLKPNK